MTNVRFVFECTGADEVAATFGDIAELAAMILGVDPALARWDDDGGSQNDPTH